MFDQFFSQREIDDYYRANHDYTLEGTIYVYPMPGDTAVLKVGNGAALTLDEVETLIDKLMAFYWRVPHEAVEEHNKMAAAERASNGTTPKQEPDRRGYVYILRSDSGEHKIGRTRNPASRLATFEVKLPFRVNYEMVIYGEDHIALEAELHERFAHCRLDGEWFHLTDQDLDELRQEFEDLAEQFNV